MKSEQDETATVALPLIPARVHVLGAVLGLSAFMGLLWPVELLGLDGGVRFVVALVLGPAVGVALARYAWRSPK